MYKRYINSIIIIIIIIIIHFIFYLPNGQVKIFAEFKLQKNCEINSAHQNVFGAS